MRSGRTPSCSKRRRIGASHSLTILPTLVVLWTEFGSPSGARGWRLISTAPSLRTASAMRRVLRRLKRRR